MNEIKAKIQVEICKIQIRIQKLDTEQTLNYLKIETKLKPKN